MQHPAINHKFAVGKLDLASFWPLLDPAWSALGQDRVHRQSARLSISIPRCLFENVTISVTSVPLGNIELQTAPLRLRLYAL
jgi:hypothetical protein